MSDIAEEGFDLAIIYLTPPYDPAMLQPGGCGRLRGLGHRDDRDSTDPRHRLRAENRGPGAAPAIASPVVVPALCVEPARGCPCSG